MTRFLPVRRCLLLAVAMATSGDVLAAVDRVYHPYVELNEREVEYGFSWRDLDGDQLYLDRLGLGYAWSDRIFTELYVLSESVSDAGEVQRGYELELRWQLTEQGEYWADWGLLLELETEDGASAHGIALGVLWEKELPARWTATVNLLGEYEFGSDVETEFESALRSQVRYRHSAKFEPGLELYADDQDIAAGPVLLGAWRIGGARQLRWETGVVFGLDSATPGATLRGLLEYEF